ncbi:MAG: fibronectin type III domain-containing protein, partial [Elusimicrobiota bacterium]
MPARAAVAAALACLLAAAFAGPVRAASSADTLSVRIVPKDSWPPAPVADLTASAGAEGQLLLSWSAPDGNNNLFVASTPAAGYSMRIATFSVAGIGGSTTAWWNASMDVRALPAPAVSISPPAPALPGTTQYLLINQLWPGATYYAMMISSDSAGNVSDADFNSIPPAVQASTLVYDAPPPAPTGLAVVQTGTAALTVSWSSVTAYDLDFYRLYTDSTSPHDYVLASVVVVDSPTLSLVLTGLSTGTYHFRVTAVDRGAPSYAGPPLESAPSSEAVIELLPVVRPPQEPYGAAISTAAGGGVLLRWMPVTRFADGAAFAVASAPAPDELS